MHWYLTVLALQTMIWSVQCSTSNVLFGKPEKKKTPGRPGLDTDERIIFKRIIQKHSVRAWTGYIRLREGPMEGSCEHGNDSSDSVHCKNCLIN
jgi:hypothetical protein